MQVLVFLSSCSLVIGSFSAGDCLHPSRVKSCFDKVLKELTDMQRDELGLAKEIKVAEKICRLIEESKPCVSFRLSKCGSRVRPDLNRYVSAILKNGMAELCKEPGLLQAYSLHAPCIYNHTHAAFACVTRGLDQIHKQTALSRTVSSIYCRSLSDISICGKAILEASCGMDTVRTFIRVVRSFIPVDALKSCSSDIPHQVAHSGGVSHCRSCSPLPPLLEAAQSLAVLMLLQSIGLIP